MFYLILFTLFIFSNSFKFTVKKPDTDFKFVGETKHLGYFDPLKFSIEKDKDFVKYLRESELQHSRVCMISALLLPLIDKNYYDLGINFFNNMNPEDKFQLILYITFFEMVRLNVNYKNPIIEKKLFKLKENIKPGEYLGEIDCLESLREKELNNGRLAMIGTLGYIVQEMVTQEKIFS